MVPHVQRSQPTENEVAPSSHHKYGCGRKATYARIQQNITGKYTIHKLCICILHYATLNLYALVSLCSVIPSTSSASMATVPLSSSLFLIRKPMTLNFSYGVSPDKLSLGSFGTSVKFGTMKKGPRVRMVSVCRAASVVFRDLDADDFRHPLDKQV